MRRVGPALGLLLLALALPSASSAQNRLVIANVDRPTPVSAYGDAVVWSQLDETGAFRLWLSRDGGAGEMLPVSGRNVPFDADIGPANRSGTRMVVVYSRCRREPPLSALTGMPVYTRGGGCNLYSVDPATGDERRLRGVSSRRASEVLPTVWRRRLAFARVPDGSTAARLYAASRDGRGGPRRLPGGRSRNARPTGLDLYTDRLASAWSRRRGSGAEETSIDLVNVTSRRHTLVDSDPGGSLSAIALRWPTFENGKLFYARACVGDESICTSRAGLVMDRRGRPRIAPIGVTDVGHSRGGGVTYLLHDTSSSRLCVDPAAPAPRAPTCELVLTTPAYG